MWMTYDNEGPPKSKDVKALFDRARRQLPGVRIRFGQMSDFAEAILREKPGLPVVRDDTPDTWIHGIGSMPVETQMAHSTRPRIAALEALDTLLGAWGVPVEPAAAAVRDAYEETLLFGEHTWGPDVARYAGYGCGDRIRPVTRCRRPGAAEPEGSGQIAPEWAFRNRSASENQGVVPPAPRGGNGGKSILDS